MFLTSIQRVAGYAGIAKDAITLSATRSDSERQRVRTNLSHRLGRMHGLPQKVGQMLSFSNGGENAGAASAFKNLQESAEPLPWKVIHGLLEAAWGDLPSKYLTKVDPNGRAASLGQVHRAVLRSGQEVAIKVQYPGIEQAIRTDVSALGWLSLPFGGLHRGFDVPAYREMIRTGLTEELDYPSEARKQTAFASTWNHEPGIEVPTVVEDLTRENVLVTQWEEGQHWDEVRESWTIGERRKLAELLVHLFVRGLLQHGVTQADWHPGNLRFRTGPVIVMYDFGCMCRPDARLRLSLARLIRATMLEDESPWPLFMAMGFDADLLRPMASKLPAISRALFAPFCSSHPFDTRRWNLGEQMSGILGDDRWNFRMAGPPEVLYLLRSFHGLIHYLNGLEVAVHWRRCLQAVINDLGPSLDALDLDGCDESEVSFLGLARYLKIRVEEAGRVKVQITQPVASVDRLHELLDERLRGRIRDAGICLKDIVAGVRGRAYAPGPVFKLSEGEQQVSVWLER